MLSGIAKLLLPAAIVLAVGVTARAQEVRHVSIGGGELAYVEAGRGEPVILVHGGLQDYRFWQALLPRFSERYHVIAYSRRNHFPNTVAEDGAPDGAADIHGDDLAALVKTLDLGRVHVVAHSSGAVAVLFFAAAHPEMVRSLALNEPPASGMLVGTVDGASVLQEFGGRLTPAREAFRARDLDRAIPLFVDGVGGPGTFTRRSAADQQMARDNGLSHLADNITSRQRVPFTCDAARRITAPALLTNGELSPKYFHRIQDELEHCLPMAQRTVIPAASHTVPGENPQFYGEVVLAFLSKH
jgi:non-heme chloroperoxidase